MNTIAATLQTATDKLGEISESPRLDAEILGRDGVFTPSQRFACLPRKIMEPG